jgi:hypothetical protein
VTPYHGLQYKMSLASTTTITVTMQYKIWQIVPGSLPSLTFNELAKLNHHCCVATQHQAPRIDCRIMHYKITLDETGLWSLLRSEVVSRAIGILWNFAIVTSSDAESCLFPSQAFQLILVSKA